MLPLGGGMETLHIHVMVGVVYEFPDRDVLEKTDLSPLFKFSLNRIEYYTGHYTIF